MPRTITISYEPTASLTPAPYNPRTMSEEARAKLARGIAEYGLVDPLVVRRVDRLIIGGHQRHSVAQELGLATVPVVFVDDLDDQQAAALNVLLNNPSAQGTWDYPKLSDLLSSLDAEGYDATLTGFDLGDISAMLTSQDLVPLKQSAEDDPDDRGVRRLVWMDGKYKVGLTEAEEETLTERFEAYRRTAGSSYGFVADLLGLKSNV